MIQGWRLRRVFKTQEITAIVESLQQLNKVLFNEKPTGAVTGYLQFAETVRTRKFLISKLISKYKFLEQEGRWVESYRLKKTLERVSRRSERKKWDLVVDKRSQSLANKDAEVLLPNESQFTRVVNPYDNCVTITLPQYTPPETQITNVSA